MAAKSEQADRRSQHFARALIAMQPSLQIWRHANDGDGDGEYLYCCQGFVSSTPAGLAHQLRVFGHYGFTKVEIMDAKTGETIQTTSIRNLDDRGQGRGRRPGGSWMST